MTQNPYQQQPQQPPNQQPPAVPAAQPYAPAQGGYPAGPYGLPQKRPVWPVVIGIISLCLAGLGMVSYAFQAVSNALGLNAQQEEMFANMPAWFSSAQTASYVLGVLMCVLLGIGGFLLIKRRPAGRTLHVVYIVLVVIGTVLGGILASAMMNHITVPSNLPPGGEKMFKTMMVASALFGQALALAYPVFLVIWFLRAKVRAEIACWQ